MNGKLNQKNMEATLHRLDQVLIQVDGFKPLLDYNAHAAEFEIKANFTNLIDALNQRQLVLLKQLEKVHKDKISQIASHKQTLESLRSGILTCMATNQISDSCMHDLIARSDAAVLTSGSAPFVSFRSERFLLPQAIASYGRIISHYSGHFADPSQPSSCLPLAMEEEDDHEEAHDHPAVFKQVTCGSCTSVKPNLRPWLFSSTHNCTCSKQNTRQLIKGSSRDGSVCKDPAHGDSKSMTDSLCGPSSGNRIPNVSRLQHWLLCPDQAYIHPFGIQETSTLGSVAQRKHSSTSEASEFTLANESESIAVLSGSYGQTGSLKEWLFCDTTELRDMPGLSLSNRQPTIPSTSSNAPQQWLASHSITSSAPNSTFNLLPCEFSASGPVDLSKWLSSSNGTHGSNASSEEASREQSAAGNRTSSMESVRASDGVETASMVTNEPNSPATNENEPLAAPDCCIYSQCRGGPGGPTCCGARIPFNGEKSCDVMVSLPTEIDSNVSTTQVTSVDGVSDEPVTRVSHVPSTAVIEQLNRIAASHWTEWLADSTAPSTTASSGVTRSTTLTNADSQTWLHAPLPINVSPVAQGDSKSSSSTKTNLPGSNHRGSIQSPFIGCVDVGDCMKSNCSKLRQQTSSKCKREVVDDVWLAEKLSKLACKMQSVDDAWLIEGERGTTARMMDD